MDIHGGRSIGKINWQNADVFSLVATDSNAMIIPVLLSGEK
jgi:hypothetical protein